MCTFFGEECIGISHGYVNTKTVHINTTELTYFVPIALESHWKLKNGSGPSVSIRESMEFHFHMFTASGLKWDKTGTNVTIPVPRIFLTFENTLCLNKSQTASETGKVC